MNTHLTSWTAEANAELTVIRKQTRYLTNAAVKAGILFKPKTCPLCGSSKKIEAHHLEYPNHLAVEWYCQKCHRALHARLNQTAAHRVCVPFPYPERKSGKKASKNEQKGMRKGGQSWVE